jgi:flavodoxin I
MAKALDAETKRPRFGVVTGLELTAYDLLVVGSPTQEGKELKAISSLLDAIPDTGLKYAKVAAFDTRHKWRWVGTWGYAAPSIANLLTAKGGELIIPPEGFIVNSTQGPIKNGELKRAAAWAKSMQNK